MNRAVDQVLQSLDLRLVLLQQVCAWNSSSKAPASYFATHTRMRFRETSWRRANQLRLSPPRNSCATWRLNPMP